VVVEKRVGVSIRRKRQYPLRPLRQILYLDFENRLTQAVVAGTGTTTFRYDPFGRRIQKSGPLGTTNYLYDGYNLLETVGSNGSLIARYVEGQTVDEPFAESSSAGTTYYDIDALSSVTSLTNSSAAISNSDTYDSFGKLVASTDTNTNPFRYTGKERDSESGLDDFEARYYSSSMGRFMQPDPLFATPLHVVNPQRWNMYAYVVNNPTNYIDPDGKDAIAVNFVNEVPLGGHEGVIVVHADGSATYARFGPEHAASPADAGKVTVQALNSVTFQGNGLPTDASYKELSEEVAKIEGQPASTVGFNYFKTSEADSIALDNWMQEWKTHQAPDYNVTNQNCATFCIAGLIQGHAIENKNISIIPNRLFTLLSGLATENWTWQGRTPKEKVTHKICWTDDKGKQQCQ
jgi:RHS repeat-associated protein